MNPSKSDKPEREQRILDAAAQLIIHYGYDKTSVHDIAVAAGISKGAIYLHFASKDDLFEALLYREVQRYADHWFARIEADPQGGTIGGIYKAVLYALNQNPFMSAIVKHDPQIFGNYLHKPNNLFTSSQSPGLRAEFLQAMQAAGVVRADINPQAMAYVMDMLSFGLVGVPTLKSPSELPPFDTVMATIAEMLDRMLTPPTGDPNTAGKAIIRELADKARTQWATMYQATKEGKQ